MESELYLGIDTSNYTTSAALVDADGTVIANLKRPLAVESGERGLRQSDAVFLHVRNLPELMLEVKERCRGYRIAAIGVSEKPRNAEGSYMPCFLSGVAAAESAGAACGAPVYRFSHQCGHLMAALYSAGKCGWSSRPFAAFHLSGGTTELLVSEPGERGFRTTCIGGTRDLNAGQVIDRIGVVLGLAFPCGPALEKLAAENRKPLPGRRRVPSEGGYVNLSGLENLSCRLYRSCGDPRLTAAFVLDYLGEAVLRMAESLQGEYASLPLLFAGGVMSNRLLQARLRARYPDAAFAEPAFSSDNAAGIALLSRRAYLCTRHAGVV